MFPRYAWVRPLKNKKHDSIVNALKDIFQGGRIPTELRTDKGEEWINSWTKQYLKRQGVHQYFTQNVTHANYAERFIHTLKTLMYRYFTHNRTYRNIEVLPNIVRNYNNRPHRSLDGLSPSDVDKENEDMIWKMMYLDVMKPSTIPKRKQNPRKRFKFKIGDNVIRLSTIRHTFQRDYEQRWAEEVFLINRRFLRQGIPVYKVVDYDKEPIDGTFYEAELQRVNKSRDDLWKVKKNVKTTHVWWRSFSQMARISREINSWIKEKDLQDI